MISSRARQHAPAWPWSSRSPCPCAGAAHGSSGCCAPSAARTACAWRTGTATAPCYAFGAVASRVTSSRTPRAVRSMVIPVPRSLGKVDDLRARGHAPEGEAPVLPRGVPGRRRRLLVHTPAPEPHRLRELAAHQRGHRGLHGLARIPRTTEHLGERVPLGVLTTTR